MSSDLLPAKRATPSSQTARDVIAEAGYVPQISHHFQSPLSTSIGSLDLQLVGPSDFEYSASSEPGGLTSHYALLPTHGPLVFNCAPEVEQEAAPTWKRPPDVIARLSSIPPVVNTVDRFTIIDDDVVSTSEMITPRIHWHWSPHGDEVRASQHAVKLHIPLLSLAERMVVPSFNEQILATPQPAQTLQIIAQLRKALALAQSRYEQLDHTTRLERLRETAAALQRREPLDLLNALADERGLSWQTISTMLGVSSSAVRKWRRGASVAPENREQIAALVAFFEQTAEIQEPIADIGSWMEMRIREDTTLTPAVIYASGSEQRWLLLEWMRGYLDATAMLDRFDDSWRERYARDPNFRVVETEAGERAIVPR